MSTSVPNYPSSPFTFPLFVTHDDGQDIMKFFSRTEMHNVKTYEGQESYEVFTGSNAEETLIDFEVGALASEGYLEGSRIQWDLALFAYEQAKATQAA